MKQQQGFTLVELIVVIAILGILAATALPRFINVSSDARIATLNGLVGSLSAAAQLCQAAWTAKGSTGTTCDMVGAAGVLTNASGIPTGAVGGIGAAMQSTAGATPTYGSPTTTYTLQTNCTATYNDTTGIAALGTTTGC